MEYREALGWLYGLESRGIKLDLGRVHDALALLGNPQDPTARGAWPPWSPPA